MKILVLPSFRSSCPLLRGVVTCFVVTGCQSLSSYSTTSTQQYVGCVVPADFVLAGISPTTQLSLTLDANNLQTQPGTLSTSDGRFQSTPMRPIPQLWNDPLSTFNFGEGRTKNLVYMATPSLDAGGPGDVTIVVSLMDGGNVEVRLLRGAPPMEAADASGTPPANNVFAVFPLTLQTWDAHALSAKNCAPDAAP
jgi:hypothetical protein